MPEYFRQIRIRDWLDEAEMARGDSFERYLLARKRYWEALRQWAVEHGYTETDVVQRTRWDRPRGGLGRLYVSPREAP